MSARVGADAARRLQARSRALGATHPSARKEGLPAPVSSRPPIVVAPLQPPHPCRGILFRLRRGNPDRSMHRRTQPPRLIPLHQGRWIALMGSGRPIKDAARIQASEAFFCVMRWAFFLLPSIPRATRGAARCSVQGGQPEHTARLIFLLTRKRLHWSLGVQTRWRRSHGIASTCPGPPPDIPHAPPYRRHHLALR